MNFEKLALDAFSKEKLVDNKLRSINGGHVNTCRNDSTDYVNEEGDTYFADNDTMECDICW